MTHQGYPSNVVPVFPVFWLVPHPKGGRLPRDSVSLPCHDSVYNSQTKKNKNNLLSKEEGTHPVLQCAAVRTQYLCTRDPTQKCWPFEVCKDTIYLTECSDGA